MRLYVGNLSFSTDSAGLENLFAQYGDVASVDVITDRMTGRARGFAFVEMESESEAQAAISALNGTDFEGRQIRVDVAQQRTRQRGEFSDR